MTNVRRRPPLGLFPDQPNPRLYDRIVEVFRVHHYSKRTEQAYVHWIRKFIEFCTPAHPRQLAEVDVNRFLTHLAVKEHVAASTQNQALSSLLFLYKYVFERPLDSIDGVVRAHRSKRLPVVLTIEEVQRVMAHLSGDKWLIATLLYGGGLRLLEALRLRVKDLEFERGEITVRQRKGDKDRVTMLPQVVISPLQNYLRRVHALHQRDLADGYGRVELPYALARKFPKADREWGWQYVFPQERRWQDPKTGDQGRHHLDESIMQKAVTAAVRRAALAKRVTLPHVPAFLRDPFADGRLRHSHRAGIAGPHGRPYHYDLHARLNRGGRGVRSPADQLGPRPD